ncbi:bZIP transcription factor 12 [Elaeis guineensis]|uniref:BZIP transcription factor 12 n=1 Tax=Elaeis guineensis var. tenera TaxID=51953 RepID=A0A6I9QMP9_ELAGV|nr:bZIP transcription factor 12 [Elaeis guineensis]XP_010912001.1 bZIP transcription factor 12 [Elaeis guineensis]
MAKPNSNPRIPRMASSRVMASSSSANSDLARQSSIFPQAVADLQGSAGGDPLKTLGSMSMEDLLRVYPENAAPFASEDAGSGGEASASGSQQGSLALPKEIGSKTVEEVWREIAAGRKADGGDRSGGQMTLEDFLARAGAVREEELRVPSGSVQGGFGLDSAMGGAFSQQQQLPLENPVIGFGNEVHGGGGRRGGRGRKRPVLDPVDRAALQRQKRMIKNRESAARSRERKQAYTAELESLVSQLEEENVQLLKYQEEQHKERLQQLMENVIPVTEKKKPKRPLRRTCSMQW